MTWPEFAQPTALWLLLLVPAMALAAWLFRRRGTLPLPIAGVLLRGPRGWRTRLRWLPTAAACLAVALGSLALARPQLPSAETKKRESEGIDLAVAVDLSTSMTEQDMGRLTRLEAARAVLDQFIRSRGADRIALVVFSGAAYTQVPLTLDHELLAGVTRSLEAGRLEDGTAIGDAVGTALNRLRDSEAKSRAVVLITDGDNNSGRLSPGDAARMARELGIPVFPILIGDDGAGRGGGGRVERASAPRMPVNPALLEQMAQTSEGTFFRATDAATFSRSLQSILDRMQRSTLSDGQVTAPRLELYGPLLAAAAALGLLAAALRLSLLRVYP